MKRVKWSNKFIFACLTLLLVILLIGGCGKPAPKPGEVIELKLGHWTPVGSIWYWQYDAFIKEVEEKSNGRVKITHYPVAALGSPATHWELLMEGAIHFTQWLEVYFPGKYPLAEAFSLPFISSDSKSHVYAMQELADKGLLDKIFYDEVHMVGAGHSPANQILTKGPKVVSPNDLSGVKIRGLGGAMTLALEQVGAAAVTVPYPEMYSALEKGVVESIMTDYVCVVDNHLDDFIRYALQLNACVTTCCFVTSKKSYDSWPEDIQEIVDKAGKNSIGPHLNATAQRIEEGKKLITDKGGSIYVPTDAEREAWKNAFMLVWDEWFKRTAEKGIPREQAEQFLHEYGAAVKKNGGEWPYQY